MQNRIEHSTGFMKTFKEKIRDWWGIHGKLWTRRCIEYIVFAVLFSSVGAGIFVYFDLAPTKPISALYMLSALVQSQAAIVAIVVSLTLIAVQLTASTYSPRVIRIFRDNPDMWLLLVLYGSSIFYGLLILKTIKNGDLSQIPLLGCSLESHIFSAYLLGIFSFMMLFRYMLSIMDLLTAENIINQLATEITKAKLLETLKLAKTSEGVERRTVDDPIQPIVNIIHASIMKYDLETTRVGLKEATEQVIKIIVPDDEEKISGHFCKHLERVGRLAISREDEESTIEVIKNLANFGKSSAEKELEQATSKAVESLQVVERASAEKGLEDATREIVVSLREVGRAAAEKGLEDAAWNAAEFLEAVGKDAMEKGLEVAKVEVTESLYALGQIFMDKGLKTATARVVKALLAVRQIAEKVVASDLANLTRLNEEIVKTAIKTYESKLKEQDRDSFQKFMKIYKQKLEILRPKE